MKLDKISLERHFQGSENLVKLSKILLSSLDIISIDPKTFEGLEHITLLNLRYNKLSSIPPTIFQGMKYFKIFYY